MLAAQAASPAWSPAGTAIAFVDRKGIELGPLPVGADRGCSPARPMTSLLGRSGRATDAGCSTRSTPPGLNSPNFSSSTSRRDESRTCRRLASTTAASPWTADGSIAYTRARLSGGADVWLTGPNRRAPRQITRAFPAGLDYGYADWAVGSVPRDPRPPENMLMLQAAAVQEAGSLVSLTPDGAGNGVAYGTETSVNLRPGRPTVEYTFTVWTPFTAVRTTTTDCDDYGRDWQVVASSRLVAWLGGVQVSESSSKTVLGVSAPGGEQLGRWDWDPCYPASPSACTVADLVGSGPLLAFETWGLARGGKQLPVDRRLWKISQEGTPQRVEVPLPADAGDALDGENGRLLLATTSGGLLVIDGDGQGAGPVAGPAAGRGADQRRPRRRGQRQHAPRLRRQQRAAALPALASPTRKGVPRLLALGNGYAAYSSGSSSTCSG